MRILLNGKKAILDPVRSGIFAARESLGKNIEVRPTWEAGDIQRLVKEAINEGVERIVAGGGDGTVNEVVNALAQFKPKQQPSVAILPLGTANDFATSCQIPTDVEQALISAANNRAHPVDLVKVNDMHFINVASAGFGAHVTATTPTELKNFLGGKAYTLAGLVKALNLKPYKGKAKYDNGELEGEMLIGAICNGRQAGGGQPLAPNATINDGLMDVIVVQAFPLTDAPKVLQELLGESNSDTYVKRFQCSWLEYEGDDVMPLNLDGEPHDNQKLSFKVIPKAIDLVLPEDSPVISQ